MNSVVLTHRPITLQSWPWDFRWLPTQEVESTDESEPVFWPSTRGDHIPPQACDFLSIRKIRLTLDWDVPPEIRPPDEPVTCDCEIEAGTCFYLNEWPGYVGPESEGEVMGAPLESQREMLESRGLVRLPNYPGSIGIHSALWQASIRLEWVDREEDDIGDWVDHHYRLRADMAWGLPEFATMGGAIGWTPPTDILRTISPAFSAEYFQTGPLAPVGESSAVASTGSYLLRGSLGASGLEAELPVGPLNDELVAAVTITERW